METQGRKMLTPNDIVRRLVLDYWDRRINWHRQLTTLSAGGLTLLVSLQSSYVPQDAQGLFVLKCCWGALAIAVCSGVLVQIGSAQTPLDSAADLHDQIRTLGPEMAAQLLEESNGIGKRERWPYRMGETLLVAAFLVALVSLTLFATLNV